MSPSFIRIKKEQALKLHNKVQVTQGYEQATKKPIKGTKAINQ